MPALKSFTPTGSAVVGHENEDRVAVEPLFGERGAQPADLGVDLFDRREEERRSVVDFLLVIIRP